MRSKEVEESIKTLTVDRKMVLNGGNNVIASADDINTVLSYIEELEKIPNKIRDKIKDIETQIKGEKTKIYTIPECFLILKTLKSIIGG